jgi:hypothetical protein
MRRNWFYLNAVLALGIIAATWQLRQQWLDARERETMARTTQLPGLRYQSKGAAAAPGPVNAVSFQDVAMRTLFSKDRNPTVVVEVKAPPPKPPVPPFPRVHGLMTLGEPRILLSDRNQQRSYRAGERVGPFEIVAFDQQTIKLRWVDQNEEFTKRLDELVAKDNPMGTYDSQAAAAQGAAAAAPPPAAGTKDLGASGKSEPGADLGNSTKSCQAGDSSPAGTVSNGMRKVVVANPFGQSCYWEPVK